MSTQLQRRIPDEWFSFDDCLNFCEAYRDPMIVCAAQSKGIILHLPPFLLFVHVDPMDKDTMDDADVVARVLHCFDVNVSLGSNFTVVE